MREDLVLEQVNRFNSFLAEMVFWSLISIPNLPVFY